jgi:hypothetical protein
VDALCQHREFREVAIQLRTAAHTELITQLPVPRDDAFEHRFMFAGQRCGQQFLEAIGDAAHRGMHDEHMRTIGAALACHGRDVVPVGQIRNARAAKLQHDPARIARRHGCSHPVSDGRGRSDQAS